MKKKLEVQAKTLAEARTELNGKISSGFYLISMEETKPIKLSERAVCETVDQALISAKQNIPLAATDIKEIVRSKQYKEIKYVNAFNENEARRTVSDDNDNPKNILSVAILKNGRLGFFGFCKKPNVYIIELLNKAIVDVEYRTYANISAEITDDIEIANKAFLESARTGNLYIVENLLNQGVDINFCDSTGKNALLLSVQSNQVTISLILVNKGIDVHKQDEQGNTALNLLKLDERHYKYYSLYNSAKQLESILSEKGVTRYPVLNYGVAPNFNEQYFCSKCRKIRPIVSKESASDGFTITVSVMCKNCGHEISAYGYSSH